MPHQTPEPGRDDEQAAVSAGGRPYLDWQALLEALAAGGFLTARKKTRTRSLPRSRRRWRTGG